MTKTTRAGLMGLLALMTPTALAQTPAEKATPDADKTPGGRLAVQFVEVREREGAPTISRQCLLTLHADAKPARLFVGTQVALSVKDGGATTTTFKNAGLEAEATVETVSDGLYKVRASFERGGLLGETVPGENPIMSLFRGKAVVVVRGGETVPLATAIDPVTGDRVRVDLTVAAAPSPRIGVPVPGGSRRLRAAVVLTRRQGERILARRPYAILVQAGSDEDANVFSGNMLPVQTTYKGQPTVMLKDVGTGLRLFVRGMPDGRYRIDLNFSDGSLAAAASGPFVRAFQSDSQLFVHEGETLTLASAVDPQTGDTIEAEVTFSAAR